jgi:hypothetical protein
MSNILSKDQLIEMRVELEAEVNEKQEAAAVAKFEVDFETTSNINAVLKQIDKSYKWTIKDAAFAINLYDNLKTEKIAITKSGDISCTIALGIVDLNTLYKVLTSIEGVGIESARTFTSLLTNIGKQITDAMKSMADVNREIQELHVSLGELDSKIAELSKETVEADEISQ